jgi:hypothetical protein
MEQIQVKLMDEKGAAARLAASVAFLRRCRLFKTGPVYKKIGKLVRYSEEDLQSYLSAASVKPSVSN